ncbi:hypothetical protein Salat_1126200 [Sesamum alatum]|uniref:Uncharacterized protein n=1 Tax=Sesamum alatum TaxID=300844 RepID=A0AAE1YE98_9LAMI|nr:hypothetical protein Salat_1126200 [Sesamum alatum]
MDTRHDSTTVATSELQQQFSIHSLPPQSFPSSSFPAPLPNTSYAHLETAPQLLYGIFSPFRRHRPYCHSHRSWLYLPRPTSIAHSSPFASGIANPRAKGLCFNCDEHFHPDHKCHPKQFLLMLSDEDPPDPDLPLDFIRSSVSVSDPPLPTSLLGSEVGPNLEHFHLSSVAISWSLYPRILRLTAIINDRQLLVLVDWSSSHNIMQPQWPNFCIFHFY